MNDIQNLFPKIYETSRQRFHQNLAFVQSLWPQAQLVHQAITGPEDLTIDWIQANGSEENQKIFILTTGEHGIEGFVGSAMLQRFIDVFLPRLNPKNTGLLLLHTINPWGMRHHRRTNANNVDLNRNFVYEPTDLDPDFNPEHQKLDDFLTPSKPIRSYLESMLVFWLRYVGYTLSMGWDNFRGVILLGQYRNPKGIHYGGTEYQPETLTLMRLLREAFEKYNQILHLDMHTGYGPRYQMSLVNSAFEETGSQEFVERFAYPLVVATNPEEFYAIRGDLIDYVYTLWQNEFPERRLYAGAFEFGTYGHSITRRVRNTQTMVLENQLHWQGATNPRIRARVQHEFEELFSPQAEDWRLKALADADQAFEGILEAEGYI